MTRLRLHDMARFEFEARRRHGKIQRGATEARVRIACATAQRGLRRSTSAKGIAAVRSMARAQAPARPTCAGPRAKLSSLLGALPLEAALVATIEQAERKHVADSLSAVCDSVRAGMQATRCAG